MKIKYEDHDIKAACLTFQNSKSAVNIKSYLDNHTFAGVLSYFWKALFNMFHWILNYRDVP